MSELHAADKVRNSLNKSFGGRVFGDLELDEVMAQARNAMLRAGAEEVEKHLIRFVGEVDGKRSVGVAETVLGRFSSSQWVAFCAYHNSENIDDNAIVMTRALRPFTEETKAMAWLESFISRELGG